MNRDNAIDMLKFLAVLVIFNAHSTMLYPVCPWLSTGGYIGDALFFFCSGYAIFLGGGGRFDRFDTWYKRRLSRIWPSCLAWGFVACFIYANGISVSNALLGIGWFVRYILVCYAIIWLLGKFLMHRMRGVFAVSIVIALALCSFVLWSGDCNPNHWKWPLFFPVILMGAIAGINGPPVQKPRFFVNCIACVLAFVAFELSIALGTRLGGGMRWLQLCGVPLMPVFVVYAYRTVCSLPVEAWSQTKHWKLVLMVGSLCLDFYLVKWTFISDALSFMFPLNLPLMLIYLLTIAYCNRAIGRFLAQTLATGKSTYDWKAVFSLY